MDKPQLSKQAFWDVNMEIIDYKKQILFVLERVLSLGTWDDFISLKRFYGDKKIRKEVIHSKELGPMERNFCCVIFKLKPQDFLYPTDKPARPEPWDFSGA